METSVLRRLLTDYPAFCEIAVKLQWAEAQCTFYDLAKKYPLGCDLWRIHFPAGDVSAHFSERLVQALLMRIAQNEEWEPDFWQIPAHERAYCLTAGAALYRAEIFCTEPPLQHVTGAELLRLIQDYSSGDPEAPPAELRRLIETGESISLSGAPCNDRDILTVTQDTILLMSCGIWD